MNVCLTCCPCLSFSITVCSKATEPCEQNRFKARVVLKVDWQIGQTVSSLGLSVFSLPFALILWPFQSVGISLYRVAMQFVRFVFYGRQRTFNNLASCSPTPCVILRRWRNEVASSLIWSRKCHHHNQSSRLPLSCLIDSASHVKPARSVNKS